MFRIRSLLRNDVAESADDGGTAGGSSPTSPPDPADEGRSSGRRFRVAGLALALVGLAVLVASRVRNEGVPSSATVRETVDDGVPTPVAEELPTATPDQADGDGAADADPGSTEPETADTDTDLTEPEPAPDADADLTEPEPAAGTDGESTAPTTDTDTDGAASADDLEERAVDDAHEEPAEPGEITVDEDVVDVVEDEASESGRDDDHPDGERE